MAAAAPPSTAEAPPGALAQHNTPGAAFFSGADQRPVILFDGMCNLCNGGVNFVLDWDKEGVYRFAALQSEAGRELLARSGRERGTLLAPCVPGARRSISHGRASSSLTEGRMLKALARQRVARSNLELPSCVQSCQRFVQAFYDSVVSCKKFCLAHADDISSIVLVTKDRSYVKSEAVMNIAQRLRMPLSLVATLSQPVPSPLRNLVYDWVANNRYKIFGESSSCRLMQPEVREAAGC